MIEIFDLDLIENKFRGFNQKILIPKTIKVLNELEDYWPLTLRQVYYRLVAAQLIDNNLNRYQGLSVWDSRKSSNSASAKNLKKQKSAYLK